MEATRVLDLTTLDEQVAALSDEQRGDLHALFPHLTLLDAAAVVLQRPGATEVRPYAGWLRTGRRVRHGERGIVLPQQATGVTRARVFDVDQTDPDPDRRAHRSARPVGDLPAGFPTTHGEAARMTVPQPAAGSPAPFALATCSYTEFRPEMGLPVRFTVGAPRWKLSYTIAGAAKLITPRRDMLSLAEDAYTFRYLQILNGAGVAAIGGELAGIVAAAGGAKRVVLLCFERLAEPPKAGQAHNWCHRSLFGAWWKAATGQDVPELGALPATGRPYVPPGSGLAGAAPEQTLSALAVEEVPLF